MRIREPSSRVAARQSPCVSTTSDGRRRRKASATSTRKPMYGLSAITTLGRNRRTSDAIRNGSEP